MIFFLLMAGFAVEYAITFLLNPTWDGALFTAILGWLAYDQWKNRNESFPWRPLSKMFICLFAFAAALFGLIAFIAERNVFAGIAAVTFATIFVYQWRHLND